MPTYSMGKPASQISYTLTEITGVLLLKAGVKEVILNDQLSPPSMLMD